MSQEKSAEIIDLSASRAAAAGDGAGPFLMSARLAAGLDIQEVAAATKIRPSHIEAIETGNMAALPATPYAVGFVKVYAAYLGLDADEIAAEFRREVKTARPQREPERNLSSPPAYESSAGVKIGSLFGIAVILAFAIWIGFQIAGNGETDSAGVSANAGPRVRVSDSRAEAPRPRVISAQDYEVAPMPQAGVDPVADDRALNTPLDELIAPADGGDADPVMTPDTETVIAPEAAIEPALDTPPVIAPLVAPVVAPTVAPTVAPAVAEAAVQKTAPAEASVNGSEEALSPAPVPVEALPVAPPVATADTAPLPSIPTSAPASAPINTPSDPVVTDARLVLSIGPRYPARCERGAAALEAVSVIFDVNANGRPTNPRVTSSSNDCFDDAAVATISKWRFDPRTVDGAPRPQTNVEATLNFRR